MTFLAPWWPNEQWEEEENLICPWKKSSAVAHPSFGHLNVTSIIRLILNENLRVGKEDFVDMDNISRHPIDITSIHSKHFGIKSMAYQASIDFWLRTVANTKKMNNLWNMILYIWKKMSQIIYYQVKMPRVKGRFRAAIFESTNLTQHIS